MTEIDWRKQSGRMDFNEKPTAYIMIKGVTAHEFMSKWNELIAEYGNVQIAWEKIRILYDVEFFPSDLGDNG